jgi:hypothetical protein
MQEHDKEYIEELGKGLLFLRALGYRLKSYTKEVDSDGDIHFKVTYENSEIDRRVSAIFIVMSDVSQPNSLYFYIYSEKQEDYFSVEDFVVRKLGKESEYFFDNINFQPNVSFISVVTNYLEVLCSNELKFVIDGTEWIDIPFDWQGHK